MRRDEEIFDLILEEQDRQVHGLELIASENFVSDAVLEAAGNEEQRADAGIAGQAGASRRDARDEVAADQRALFHDDADVVVIDEDAELLGAERRGRRDRIALGHALAVLVGARHAE